VPKDALSFLYPSSHTTQNRTKKQIQLEDNFASFQHATARQHYVLGTVPNKNVSLYGANNIRDQYSQSTKNQQAPQMKFSQVQIAQPMPRNDSQLRGKNSSKNHRSITGSTD
jgi:hypothetical protein